ncbi:MAG TPA: hypothetical protein VF598_04580 [Hymenobacter sp.]|jgi:hypothetical protein
MKRTVAKSCSIEKVADLYLAELEKVANDHNPSLFLSEVLRKQGVFFDKGIIESALLSLEERNYIQYTGVQTQYNLITDEDFNRLLLPDNSTMEQVLEYVRSLPSTLPTGISASIKSYKITGEGARFVRMGQVLDINGKLEREADRKKFKERWINAGIAIGTSLLTLAVKAFFFDK